MNNNMKESNEILKKANITPLLNLAEQLEGGGVKGTGPHVVTLISDELGTKKDFKTGEDIDVVWFTVEEDGVKKKYAVPVKDKEGDIHYLLQRLGPLAEGTKVTLEFKRKGIKGYIDISTAEEVDTLSIDLETEPLPDEIPF